MNNGDRATPFDLSIENQYRDQATPVLYIVSSEREDDDSQHVRFRFTNKSGSKCQLKALSQADADNFHFALLFRPSTLNYASLEDICGKFKAAIGDNWKVGASPTREDATVVIYFSAKAAQSIQSNESISFLVKGLSGAAATGSRSTQVQLKFREPVGDRYFVSTRNQHLDVVNHDGKTFAPLDFVVLGAPTIVHRSMDNTVRVQVIETNGRNFRVSEKTFIDFKIPFYTGDYDPNYHPAWVFGGQSEVNTITCQKDEKEATVISTDLEGSDVILGNWGYKSIRVKFEKDESIDNLILKFMNVPANGPIGDARIKISVCNLPGYWDTEFEVKLEKTLVTTDFYEPWNRSFGLLNNQVIVGMDLPDGWQKEGALHSSLSVTSAKIRDEKPSSEVDKLLCLHDGKIGMEGMYISVGNWQKTQNPDDPPKEGDVNLKDRYLIKADQYNHGTRFKVDFFGNLWADGEIRCDEGLYTGGVISAKGDISTEGRIRDSTGDVMPVGAIVAFGGSESPEGWLLCDGKTSLTDAKYADLKKAIGLDKTPDLQSRFVVGAGKGDGLSSYPIGLGEQKGEETHKLSTSELPIHSHKYYRAKWNTMQWSGGGRDPFWTDNINDRWTRETSDSVGGDQSHNNLPPYFALTYIIKY